MSVSSRKKPHRAQPFAIRLSEHERAELTRRAGEMALGAYIKAVVFADGDKRKRRGARSPIKDHALLAEVLACLGRSGLTDSIAELSAAAQSGTLYVDDSVTHALKSACDDIVVMRLLLLKSLGFQVDLEDQSQSVSQAFTRAAHDDGDQS